ncbi:MAG TPA: hypothetical protein VK653_06025 [Xanthobacteraceae bacterium]|nr:hypothetical protein [Xanthobacteraceae bacterium]
MKTDTYNYMNSMSSVDPTKRQVLVNIGNRFIVFGPDARLPEPIHFTPEDSAILPRVADESEGVETRITESLQVFGMTRGVSGPHGAVNADIELVDNGGKHILVDIKVRERDPKQHDLQSGSERLDQARSKGENLEVWFFNIERLKLFVLRRDGPALRIDELVPLNVWEKTSEGVFERHRVVEEVDDWLRRVERLYAEIREWLRDNNDLHFDQTRTVKMSEELMQKFAVTDRELSILDVLRSDQVVVSFVPRGLWLIGAWGRIDIITKDKMSILVAIKKPDKFEWHLSTPDDRQRTRLFDKFALSELMSGQ